MNHATNAISSRLMGPDPKFVVDTFIKVDDDTGLERMLSQEELLAEFECIDLNKFKVSTIVFDVNDPYSGINIPFPIKPKIGSVEISVDTEQTILTLSINEKLSVALRAGVASNIEDSFVMALVGIHYKGAGFRDGFRGLLKELQEDDRSTWSLCSEGYSIK